MLGWNFIASQIATIAFDIVYFGAIIGTIVVIILDNRNPVKTMAWNTDTDVPFPSWDWCFTSSSGVVSAVCA